MGLDVHYFEVGDASSQGCPQPFALVRAWCYVSAILAPEWRSKVEAWTYQLPHLVTWTTVKAYHASRKRTA